jgi:hypothetical protein
VALRTPTRITILIGLAIRGAFGRKRPPSIAVGACAVMLSRCALSAPRLFRSPLPHWFGRLAILGCVLLLFSLPGPMMGSVVERDRPGHLSRPWPAARPGLAEADGGPAVRSVPPNRTGAAMHRDPDTVPR